MNPGKRGVDLLHDPALNKGTAFTDEERRRLGLTGLLPPRVSTMEQQVRRVLANIRGRSSPLAKYIELISLLDRNETLFYRVVIDNIEEMLPLIYTPVVGAACQAYGHIFRRSRGLFLTRHDRGAIREVLRNWPRADVRVVVVTDGERILGLGDLGANGMGIPVGKLCLYTACAGLSPDLALPVTLDVGTDNQALLDDPLYLGLAERRLRGAEYDALVEEFLAAVGEVFPRALIQFEDFGNRNAFRLLERYRERICCFNDDIQGTAAVTLAGLYSAARLTGSPLRDQRILFHGAGEAAVGIARLIAAAMVEEGLSQAEATARCWFMDSRGLVVFGRADLQEHKKAYAHPHPEVGDLASAVRQLKPTVLIGASGKAAQFTRDVIGEMARANERPLVFALSNPTANAECTAEQAYAWSEGRAIFAGGSPFAPVNVNGRLHLPGQANNAYIFPGVGLGLVACGARRTTDEMFFTAAKILAGEVEEHSLSAGALYPPLARIREVSARIAAGVAEIAYRRDLAVEPRPGDLPAFIRGLQYVPVYTPCCPP